MAFDEDLFVWYQRLIALRQASPALRRGEYRTLLADDARRLFAFARQADGDTAIVVFDADELMQTVELPADEGDWEDVLNGGRYTTDAGTLTLTLPPQSGAVLRK